MSAKVQLPEEWRLAIESALTEGFAPFQAMLDERNAADEARIARVLALCAELEARIATLTALVQELAEQRAGESRSLHEPPRRQ